MFIFKEHKHSEYVILAGSMAVKHANGDRDELLLVKDFFKKFFYFFLLVGSLCNIIYSTFIN